MGYGLHVGDVIEGAIGTMYKIDCTLVSKHVHLAETLEGLSKRYKTKVIASHHFIKSCSLSARKMLRIIDTIEVTGFQHPIALYTFDVTTPPENGAIFVDVLLEEELQRQRDCLAMSNLVDGNNDSETVLPYDEERDASNAVNQNNDELNNNNSGAMPVVDSDNIWEQEDVTHICFDNSAYLKAALTLHKDVNASFYRLSERGVYEYLRGEYRMAQVSITKALEQRKNDGPLNYLLEKLKKTGYGDVSNRATEE